MVADTQKWEQSAAFLLDSHPGVKKWVKNDRLGFFIPYRNKGVPARYVPDFISRRIRISMSLSRSRDR